MEFIDVLSICFFSGPDSWTGKIYSRFMAELRQARPDARIHELQLRTRPSSFLTYEDLPGRDTRPPEEARLLVAARSYVFAFPTWNFGPPAQVKAFLDQAVLPGVTYRFRDGAPDSVVRGRPVAILGTAGGTLPEGWAQPYASVAQTMSFLGCRVLDPVYPHGLDLSPGREPGPAWAQTLDAAGRSARELLKVTGENGP